MSLEKEHIVLIVFCLLVHFLVFLFLPQTELDQFVDPDAYMRLVRCLEFMEHWDFRDHVIDRSNAPDGEILHWSRPMDLLLVGGSWPLRLWLGDREGLSLFAYWISPLLQAGLLAFLLPALVQRVGRLNAFHFGFLLMCQPALLGSFVVGRPDHHSLLLVLFGLAAAAAFSRMTGWAWLAGLSCGVAAWVSIEALATCLPFYGYWALRYLSGKQTAPREALAFTASWLVVAIPAVWLETPEQLFHPGMTDRLSAMHVLALLLGCCLWAVLIKCEPRMTGTWRPRLVLLALGGGASLAILLSIFPELTRGPYADVHPELVSVWLSHVKEVQPLLTEPGQWLKQTTAWLWPVYLSVPWLLVSWRRWLPILFTSRILLWALATVFFTALAFYQIRWVTYVELLWLFPCLFCLEDALQWVRKKTGPPWQRVLVVACVMVFAGGNLPIVIALQRAAGTAATEKPPSPKVVENQMAPSPITGVDLADVLIELSPSHPRTILTRLGLGPELLYRTHHRVIATPYHRNDAGMLFLRQTMRSQNMGEILRDLRNRQVDWILLEPESPELSFYGTKDLPDSFHQRLLSGQYPDWLKKIPLPDRLESRYRLFQVGSPHDPSDGDGD
jgi:hypothetical protein